MKHVLTEQQRAAIVREAFNALEMAEKAYQNDAALYAIRALGKNSFPTLFRSFFEIGISNIANESELIEASYDYFCHCFDGVDLLVCSEHDLNRPKKNDDYDDYPLFLEAGIEAEQEDGETDKKAKGFIIYTLYQHQLISLSVVSRTKAFPDIELFRKGRNAIVVDSLSAMRDNSAKDLGYALKTNARKSKGNK